MAWVKNGKYGYLIDGDTCFLGSQAYFTDKAKNAGKDC
jgi:hypothetical protein